MRCPKCGATKSSVIDSRQAEEGIRLEEDVSAKSVEHRFTTYETS